MRTNKRKYFNLIEISLATGVLAIGAVAIIALIPPTLKQDRVSTSNLYTADVVSNIQSYITSQAYTDSDWTSSGKPITKIPSLKNNGDTITDDLNRTTWANPVYHTNLYEFNSDNGDYGVAFTTGSDTDFNGEIFIWKTTPSVPVSRSMNDGADTDPLSQNAKLIGINVELSYPTEKPYSQREKSNFYFEIFNFKNPN